MTSQFDQPVESRDSDSLRWQRHAGQDVIPLWVADTDFRSPPCVVEALARRVAHGVFGYASREGELRAAITAHLARDYGWRIQPDWLVFMPGVVPALHAAVRCLTEPGQPVLFPRPVYHHLRLAATQAPRPYSEIPLVLEDGRWVLPWQELDRYVLPGSRLLTVSNPHNPGGTVLRQAELAQLAEFCCRHDLLLCSDEIHAGLVLDPGLRHQPVAALGQDISRRTVTLMSLSKTYNFAGCSLAWVVAEDPELRRRMARDLHATIPAPSLFGAVATLAALQDGEDWRRELVDYLRGNRDRLLERLPALPGVRCDGLEATFLAWLDCSALGLADPAALFLRHGVALSPGGQFGQPGFARLNLGTRRALLDQAIDRMAAAVRSLGP